MTLSLLAAPACGKSSAAAPDGAWRDQFVFVGDEGTVLVIGVHRQSTGRAEAKAWLGRDDVWEASVYNEFAVDRAEAPDLPAALERLANGRAIAVKRTGAALALDLRTPDRAVEVVADHMVELGSTTDPEGDTTYRAGRARVREGTTRLDGWLVVEETPAGSPRLPLVDYGEFAFVVLAAKDRGVIVAKHSADRPGFDHALVSAPAPRHTEYVEIAIEADVVTLDLPGLARAARARVADRRTGHGVGPSGQPLAYDTLFLRGALTGVAFSIHPDHGSTP